VQRSISSFRVILGLLLAAPATTLAGHIAREDPAEPIFTERSFIERNAEVDIGVDRHVDNANVLTTTVAGTWVFARRVQVGLDVPFAVRFPEDAPTRGGLDDIAFSTQVLVCCQEPTGYRYFSLRGEVDAPSGDRSRDIGGTGATSLSLLAGNGFTVVRSLEDLGVTVELTWSREIRLSDGERATAQQLVLPARHEQELAWNLAVMQPLLGRRLTPVLELLGTTTVAAVAPADEGTAVELAVGCWTAPFPDDSPLSALTLAAGWRFPVTGRRADDGAALIIAEWTFNP